MDDLLTDCLSTPGWFDINADPTLYEFLAQYWNDTRWQSRIRMALDNTMLSKSTKDSFYDCIESYFPKKQRKTREKTTSGVDSIEPDDKPVIYADYKDMTRVVDDCIRVIINNKELVFQRDGVISIIAKSKRKNLYGAGDDFIRLKIKEAGVEYLQEVATRCATWMVGSTETSEVETFKPSACPKSVINKMVDRPETNFPILTGITMTPMLRHDGSVVSTTGYDPQTGIYYEPAHGYPEILENPTRQDALDALEVILEPFSDFQFKEPCHKSVVVSAIFSIHCRHLCRTVPLYAVSANTRGAGKGLIVNAISIAATGQEPAKTGVTRDDEEMRKAILAIALEGDRITVFDNVPPGPFGTASLERAITEPVVRERVLGFSKNAEVSLQTVFFATGNNMKYSDDMARRVLPIVLEPDVENPEQRSDFKIANLIDWSIENHPRLTTAALTIIKAYILDGKPDQNLPQYGSFEQWSDLVRNAVVWVGMDDPYEARESLEIEADIGYQNLQSVISAWQQCYEGEGKQLMKDVVDSIKKEFDKQSRTAARADAGLSQYSNDIVDGSLIALGEALLAFDPRANDKICDLSPRRLGQRLPINSGSSRVIDGKRLRKDTDSHTKVNWWWVEQIDMSSDDLPF